jgi:hypothetical protein
VKTYNKNSKLVGTFSEVRDYSNTVLDIRNYYGPKLIDDCIHVIALIEVNTLEIREYLYTYNIETDGFLQFRKGDMALNKNGRVIYTINGLNAVLRDKGLERGDRVDFTEYPACFISEVAMAPLIRRTKWICKA